MNRKSILTAFTETLEKNRLVKTAVLGAIALACLLLFLTSGLFGSCGDKASEPAKTSEPVPTSQAETLERRLESILAKIEGVGKVRVMLTLDSSENRSAVFSAESEDTESTQPVRGVIVAAEGAGDIAVRMNIITAVSTVLGVDPNLVEVFVMAG